MLLTLLEWFAKFPALWAIVGALATGVAAVFVFNKYGDKLIQVNDKIVIQQDKQLAMQERTLNMQKDHYEGEINELRKHHTLELNEAKREWQECRTILHDERKKWNAESLNMQLAIKEFESRPDMRSLNTTMKEMVELIRGVGDSLNKHDKSIDTRMKEFIVAMKPQTK